MRIYRYPTSPKPEKPSPGPLVFLPIPPEATMEVIHQLLDLMFGPCPACSPHIDPPPTP